MLAVFADWRCLGWIIVSVFICEFCGYYFLTGRIAEKFSMVEQWYTL
jgi:hypothetical protein